MSAFDLATLSTLRLTPSGHPGVQLCLLSKNMSDGPRGEYGCGVAVAIAPMASARSAETMEMDFISLDGIYGISRQRTSSGHIYVQFLGVIRQSTARLLGVDIEKSSASILGSAGS